MNVCIISESSLFTRREEWSPPLPQGVPRPMSCYGFLVVAFLCHDGLLSFAGIKSFVYCWGCDVLTSAYNHFLCIINIACMGFGINPCCATTAVLCKRPSLLGHCLNASFHFSKNAPISQRRAPFGILRCDDNGKRFLLVIMAVSIIAFCVWIGINIKRVFIWGM